MRINSQILLLQPVFTDSSEGHGSALSFLLETDESGNSCLEWWKQNGVHFPKVAQLVKLYLHIPPTLIPAERILSTARLVINKQRSSLTPKNVAAIFAVHQHCSVPYQISRVRK